MVALNEDVTTLSLAIGVDVGQARDPTAIAVCEEVLTRAAPRRSDSVYRCHYLERLPLGTGYVAVAKRVAAVTAGVCARIAKPKPMVVLDSTGLGGPVLEMVSDALRSRHRERPDERLRWSLWGASFVHGVNLTLAQPTSERWRDCSVGKEFLVSRLQALLACRRLRLPHTSEADALAHELQTYEIRVDDRATATFGAFKTGAHDDLVTALALATALEMPRGRLW